MEIVDAQIGFAHFGEQGGEVVDVADFDVFAALGFPQVAVAH